VERLCSAGEQDQPRDRRLCGCDAWGDGAAEAVAEQEDAARVDVRLLLQQVD
jgi:hypothetical protein